MEDFSADWQGARMILDPEKLIERESTPKRVAPRIVALRQTLRLSSAEFADAIGLDRSSMTKVEKGTMGLSIEKAERIAVLYGFGLDFIYRGDLDDCPRDLRPRMLVELHAARAGQSLHEPTTDAAPQDAPPDKEG